MEPVVARVALVLIVGVIVGGATYVVLAIMELLKKRTHDEIDASSKKKD